MAKKKSGDVQVSLTVNGEVYTATGSTIEDALFNLPAVTPKTKGIFVVHKDGKRSREIPCLIRQMRFLWAPGLSGQVARAAFLKRIALLA